MTEQVNPAQRPERLNAARALPARPSQRSAQSPGHASKILTAGLSTSLVLGIVSYLGKAAAQESVATVDAVSTTPTVAPTGVTAVVPAAVPTSVTTPYTPVIVGGSSAVPAVPATPAVPAVPATPQVIAIAVPVPVAAPQPAAPPAVTSGTTSASG